MTSQAFAGPIEIGSFSSTGHNTTTGGNNPIAIGEGAVATGSDNAIAIGAKFHGSSSKPTEGAQALGDNSIAIGQASKASTSQSIAIGQYAEITDTASQSITIGANTKVSGASSIAIGGDDAKGTDYHNWKYDSNVGRAVETQKAQFDATSAEGKVSLAIGVKTQAKADGSIALGVVSTAGGKESISIGAKSATKGTNAISLGTAASGIADNAIALGTNTVADLEGSVVLGANSTTKGSATQIKTTDKAEVGGYVYDGFAGTIASEGALVSVGSDTPNGQRKIINVAAGEITKQSTEAINGSQLYAVIDKIINKVNNGEAGPSVYTDPAGNRLVKANDGKYYPTNQVGADGQPVAGATAVDNPILSVVNPDGTTATPTAMGNIKSTVGLDSAAGQPIDAATAQTNVGKLLEAKEGLNNAATVGDLQALAQAGLDFTGNNNTDTVHRALGTKLAIEGEGDGSWDGTNSAANNLFVQADPNNNKLVVKMNQALTGLTSVETKDANGNVAKLTPAGTEVTDAKGNSANYGANGLTVKDGNGNTTTIGAASTTVSNGTDTTTITPGAITGLKDLTDASDDSSAVNKKYVDTKLGNTVSSVGTGKDGRDGKDGLDGTGAAATGLTNADGLNGKSLTDKVNALRNGEAGPSVYTDPEGNRLVKANDGKYYPANQVAADGQPLADATAVDNPILSVVNPDGTTAKPTTMGNVKSTVGLDSTAGKPIDAATAQTNVGKLLEAKEGLNNAATVGDLQALAQAGLDFTGNNNTDTVHRALGTKLAIEGEGDGSWDGTNSAANNLFVQADPNNNKLVVKMNQALTGLTSVETKDANGNVAKLTPAGTEVTDAKGNSANYGANGLTVKDGNGNTTTIGAASTTVSDGTDTTTITPGAITGLKDLTDASDGSSAVNKNYVDAKLGNIGNTVGTGKDGRDGKDGLDGTGAAATGLTNADGLNGKSLTDKVNALRNGEAGPSVYTDPAGNRLVKANDGKYYPTNQVGADGEPLAGATAVDNPILSVVNPDGTTATPTAMGNIKSTVGLDSAAGKTIDAATAQTNVGKLLEAKDGLNNAATVGDLQALAQAGLDFTGNNSTDTVHRALGTKLAIEGEGSWDGANSAANNLFVQADPNNNKLVVKMNQALTGLTSVETKDAKGNVAKLTPAGTEVTDAKGNSANYGANGLTVKDANGNSANYGANGLTVKDANGNTAISLASTNGTSSLNFAMDSNGNGTGKITGIAPGKISANSTDVVTGGQLYTLQNNVKNLTTGLNNKLNNLNAKVNRNNRQLRGGIATVTAMTNIPQVTFAGKSAIGIGVGTYENEGAISVGYSRMSDNGRVILKISAGASTEDTFNAGAGVAFQW